MRYEIKNTGECGYTSYNLGIWDNKEKKFVKTYSTVSNDYAYTVAIEDRRMLELDRGDQQLN